MANARGAIFIFIFVAIGIVGLVALAAFITQNNIPATSTISSNVSQYLTNTSVVNHTMGFQRNVTAQGMGIISPLPLLAAIFAIGAGIFVFLTVVKR